MAKSNALKKLQSQKSKETQVEVSESLEQSLENTLVLVEEILSMKVADLDFHHSTLDATIKGWSDLDRTGKRDALVAHMNGDIPVEEEDDSMELGDSDLEDDLNEEADGEEAPVAKKKATKKIAIVDSGDNPLLDILTAIENMSETEADLEVHALKENVDFTYFRLGGVLSKIKDSKFIGEYKNFREKVEAEFGMKYRKADYLINIYNNIVDSGVDWDIVKDIGWTKLKFISKLLTPENAEEWAQKAREMNASTLEQEAKEVSKSGSKAPPQVSKSSVTSMTFKVHEDERETIEAAVANSKEANETDFTAVALEAICLDYISGGQKQVKIKEPTIKQFFNQILDKNGGDAELAVEALLEGKEFEAVFGVPITQFDF